MTDEISPPRGEDASETKRALRTAKRQAKRNLRIAKSEAKRSADKLRSEIASPGVAAVRVVFAMVVANAATQFAIQAWMSYRFAKDVWSIPRPLCVAIIVALDLFAVTFMVFTYMLRRAHWLSQAYVWCIFAAGVGAQLFAAEQYGAHAAWTGPVRVFAALPALFLAASLHGLIIWRNHANVVAPAKTEPPAETVRTGPACHVATPDERDAGRAPITERPPRPTAPPAVPPVSSGAATKPDRRPGRKVSAGGTVSRTAAAKRVVDGESAKDVAAELGVTLRSVQGWVKDYREHPPPMGPPGLPMPGASIFVQSDPEPVNGFSFGAATNAQVN